MSDLDREIKAAEKAFANYVVLAANSLFDMRKTVERDKQRFHKHMDEMNAQPLSWVEVDPGDWRAKVGEALDFPQIQLVNGKATINGFYTGYIIDSGLHGADIEVNGETKAIAFYHYSREHVEELPEDFVFERDTDKVFDRKNHLFFGFDDPRDAMLFKLSH